MNLVSFFFCCLSHTISLLGIWTLSTNSNNPVKKISLSHVLPNQFSIRQKCFYLDVMKLVVVLVLNRLKSGLSSHVAVPAGLTQNQIVVLQCTHAPHQQPWDMYHLPARCWHINQRVLHQYPLLDVAWHDCHLNKKRRQPQEGLFAV